MHFRLHNFPNKKFSQNFRDRLFEFERFFQVPTNISRNLLCCIRVFQLVPKFLIWKKAVIFDFKTRKIAEKI